MQVQGIWVYWQDIGCRIVRNRILILPLIVTMNSVFSFFILGSILCLPQNGGQRDILGCRSYCFFRQSHRWSHHHSVCCQFFILTTKRQDNERFEDRLRCGSLLFNCVLTRPHGLRYTLGHGRRDQWLLLVIFSLYPLAALDATWPTPYVVP